MLFHGSAEPAVTQVFAARIQLDSLSYRDSCGSDCPSPQCVAKQSWTAVAPYRFPCRRAACRKTPRPGQETTLLSRILNLSLPPGQDGVFILPRGDFVPVTAFTHRR